MTQTGPLPPELIKSSVVIDGNNTATLNINAAKDLDDPGTGQLHAIYNNDDFIDHIYNLATRPPGAKVRILVQDSSKAVKNGHRLIRIAQRLTSSVLIRNPPQIHKDDRSSFMTVDAYGMLYRVRGDTNNYEASINFMTPRRVKKLNEFFDKSWGHGTRDQKVRRLAV